jgi:hypothetical protein
MHPSLIPEQWVMFKLGNEKRFGQIKGGWTHEGKWMYDITNSREAGAIFSIPETDVVSALLDHNWQAVSL